MMSQEAHQVVPEASSPGRKRKETKRMGRIMGRLGKLDKPQIRVDRQADPPRGLETIQDLRVLVPLVLVPLGQDLLDLVLRDLVIIRDLDLLAVLEVATVDLGVDLEPQRIKRSPMQKR